MPIIEGVVFIYKNRSNVTVRDFKDKTIIKGVSRLDDASDSGSFETVDRGAFLKSWNDFKSKPSLGDEHVIVPDPSDEGVVPHIVIFDVAVDGGEETWAARDFRRNGGASGDGPEVIALTDATAAKALYDHPDGNFAQAEIDTAVGAGTATVLRSATFARTFADDSLGDAAENHGEAENGGYNE